jgi:hypothetical protein
MEYRGDINLCYGRQKMAELQGHLLDANPLAVSKAITKTMIPIVTQCIFNQI